MTKDEFSAILRRCKGNTALFYEEREDYSVLLCAATIFVPLTAKIGDKWANIADFRHKGKAFVVKYYNNKPKQEEINQDLEGFGEILIGFHQKQKGN